MMQYSIYMRHISSNENVVVHAKRAKEHLLDDGEVRIIRITGQQFGEIEVFYGKNIERLQKRLFNSSFYRAENTSNPTFSARDMLDNVTD
jgi:CRISPR-associated endonuclease Cas2